MIFNLFHAPESPRGKLHNIIPATDYLLTTNTSDITFVSPNFLMMEASSKLSTGCVSCLFRDGGVDSSNSFSVQVLEVIHVAATKGTERYKIIVSDGVYFTSCHVAPQLFHLLKSRLVKELSVVQIGKVDCFKGDNYVAYELMHCADVGEMIDTPTE